jgi:hypothetical protein
MEPTRTLLLLLHIPEGVASVKVVTLPAHTTGKPDIAAGNGLTETVSAVWQPVGNV